MTAVEQQIQKWEYNAATWTVDLRAHQVVGERPTARYVAYIWWVWYGADGALERVGKLLSQQQSPERRNYWNSVAYYLNYPELFEGDWEQWEKRR